MTRRTINWTVLALSLIAAIGVAGGAYALHGWQLSRLSKALLVISQAREAEEKWHEAAIYLDRYLRVHPTDAAVRGQLATLYAKGAGSQDELARAVELHYRALAAGPGDAEAANLRAKLARLQIERDRFVEAEQEARKVVALQPDHPEANRALSLSLFAQWENGALATAKLGELKLVATAQKACHLNPTDDLLAEVAAAFYRDHASVVTAESSTLLSVADRHQLADGCLDELVTRNPQDPKAYLARYRYRSRYELPGAADDVAQALRLAPDDSKVVLTAAKAAQREALLAQEAKQSAEEVHAKFEQARKLYEQLVQDKSKSVAPDAFLGLGDTHQGLGKLDEAIAAWRTGLKRFTPPTVQVQFLSRIADGLLAAERADEAKDTLDAIKDLVGSLDSSVSRNERLALNQAQDLRRASWHLQRGEAAAAVPLLQDVVSRQASGTSGNATAAVAWNLIGRANAMLGEWGEAAVAFDRAAPLDPKSHATRLAAAYAWLQTGRPDLAVDRADQSVSIQPTMEALIVLATAELERQISVSVNERTWDRLDRVLVGLEKDRAALAKVVAPWRVDFLRADYALLRGRQEKEEVRGRNEAIAAIERAELDHDQSVEFWQLAALAYQRLSDDASAERALGRYRELKTTVVDQAIVQARLARARKDFDLAQRTLEEVGARASVSEQSRLRGELIDVALAKRDLAFAERLLATEAQQRPNDISLLRRGCELAMERGDLESVARWEQKLAGAGTLGNWWASYFRALRLLTSAKSSQDPQLQQALEVQAKLSDIRPHWPMPVTLRGMIELRLGRPDLAVESLKRAIQLGERRVSVFEQLIGLLALKEPAEAERYMSRLESYMPFSQRLTEIATNQELRRDNPEQAIEIAKNAVLKRPVDPFAHLWLGRLLLANKDYTAAETEFQRALELAPKDVRAWNGLFTFYVRTGATDKARETLEELRVKAELSAADRSYVLAQAYEMLGDWDSATKQYEEATGAAPDKAMIHVRLAAVHLRSDPQKAEASLRQALQVEPESAVARRMLAALLAARGDAAKLQEAESLLSRTDPAAAGIAVEDRRLNALLLAQYGDAAQAGKAAQILEDVVAKPESSLPGDRLVLSQIYENQARGSQDPKAAETKRKQAHEHLLAVASRAEAQPGQIATFIEFLLRRTQVEEARTWLDKLETLIDGRAKDDPAAIAQLIELRIRQGSADHCPAWLDRLAAADSDPLRPVAVRAKWLASQNRGAEVEPLLEPIATKLVAEAKDARERGRLSRLFGDLYFAVELRPQAERWFRAAATHDPVQFPSLALALARDKKVAEVVRLCQDHSQRDTTSRPAIVLASVLTEAGSTSEHNSEIDGFLDVAQKQHAADKQLLYTVATLRAYQSRYDEAVALYRELLKQDPKNIASLNNLAMMLAEMPDRRSESIALIDKAISIAGEQPGLLDTKGAILVYHGQARQAVPLLEAATREAGDDPRHRFHLAAAYHQVGESAKAREQLQVAIDQHLDQHVLTPTDRRLLGDLRAALLPQTTSSCANAS